MERPRHPRPLITPGWARWGLVVNALVAILNVFSSVRDGDAVFTVIASLAAASSLAIFAVDARRRHAHRAPA